MPNTSHRVREILREILELAEKGLEWEEASLAYYERIKALAEEALDPAGEDMGLAQDLLGRGDV